MVKNNLFKIDINKKEKDNYVYEEKKPVVRIKKKEPISSRLRKKESI